MNGIGTFASGLPLALTEGSRFLHPFPAPVSPFPMTFPADKLHFQKSALPTTKKRKTHTLMAGH